MLRHFQCISTALKLELLRAGYTESRINTEMTEPGSRFFQSFAVSIPSLLKEILKGDYVEFLGENKNTVIHGQIPQSEYKYGIGTKAVVPIEEIPLEKRHLIFTRINRATRLLHFQMDELPPTWDFTLVLRKTTNGFVFITSFPGIPAMPLPSRRLRQHEYVKCKEYWDNHVFLVEK